MCGGGGRGGCRRGERRQLQPSKKLISLKCIDDVTLPKERGRGSNCKHWFTTSFLGGRCRKALLRVLEWQSDGSRLEGDEGRPH